MTSRRIWRLADFDYPLPAELIAQAPLAQRSASRLLHVHGRALADLSFSDLPALLGPDDLLVVNDTAVIRARLLGTKPTGGRVELLVERLLSDSEALAQVRASHLPKPGTTIRIEDSFEVQVLALDGRWIRLRAPAGTAWPALLATHGRVPLPPYIERAPDDVDAARYQTVYASAPGAVAAPTAGLHFDAALLAAIAARGVEIARLTLHVGAGTFLPVDVDQIAKHRMHSEWFTIPHATADAVMRTRERGGRVIAVGTTALRALESAASDERTVRPGDAETRLFITPGYRFRIVDRLVTNFHLPRSTLLMLVSAFGGYDEIRRAYAHAAERRYRFFSYGDAMLIERHRLTPD
jgi:S-adenosylmethionine:tRNA ribosyltransferase-isomerase